MKRLLTNPLMIKELREEMRSKRIFVVAPVFIAILSVVSMVAVGSSSGISFNPLMLAGTSRYTLFAFVITITNLLGLIAAVFGAASFTTERERATYELLELTPLSYTDLLIGKFLHSFVMVSLVLLSSLPVFSTLYFMGGIAYMDLLLIFFYLLLFLAVVILGASCISIVAGRTMISIILSLILGFLLSIGMGILSGTVARTPAALGFATISPWLVTWQQIFAPTPLKLAGHSFPVWPFYLALYTLLGWLLLSLGRNALDARKLERNRRTRLLGLLFINLYVAIGLLCERSYSPFTAKNAEDFYQAVLLVLLVTLPFFGLGVFTDKDRIRFKRKPLIESFRPTRLLLNDPATGLFFLCTLLITVSINLSLCTGIPMKTVFGTLSMLTLWIFPWLLIFIAVRLTTNSARILFVVYLLGTLLYTLLASFQNSGKTPSTLFEFYLGHPLPALLCAISVLYYAFARIRSRKAARSQV